MNILKKTAHNSAKKTTGNSLFLLALSCMAVIVIGLLIVNYYSQNSFKQANFKRYQLNLADHARSVSYFISERENDIRELATSPVVTGFFANRAMGMTMEYGLKVSLNGIGRSFAQQIKRCTIGGNPIYSQIVFFDKDKKVLISWPTEQPVGLEDMADIAGDQSGDDTIVRYKKGHVSIISPVSLNNHAEGYVQGILPYSTFISYLVKDQSGAMILADADSIIYSSDSEFQISIADLQGISANQPQPFELKKPIAERAARSSVRSMFSLLPPLFIPETFATVTSYSVFKTSIPGYPLDLYYAEGADTVSSHRHQLLVMVSLIILAVGGFLLSALFFRAGSQNLVLETSLVESEKKEKAVAEKMEELELVIESARLGIWNWNIETGECQYNRQWAEMLGYRLEDLPSHISTWKDLLHPEDKKRVMDLLEAHLQGKSSFYFNEHRLRHADGSWIWVHDSGKVIKRDQSGRPLYAFGIHLNITVRKEAGRMLSKAKEESDRIIRNFLDTLIVVDTQMKVVRVNQATCRLLGYSESALLEMEVTDLFHDPPDLIRDVFTLRQGNELAGSKKVEELRNIELCYRDVNGEKLPMSFNISALYDEDGKITGVVAGAKDISNLRQVMDELAQQKDYIATLFDIVPEGLLALSGENRIVMSNKAFKAILTNWSANMKISEEDLQGLLIAEIDHGRDKGNSLFTISLREKDKTAYFRCSIASISHLEGISHVISLDDITADRRAQEEKKLIATVIEQASDSVIITNKDFVIQYANPATTRNTGYSEEELIGQNPEVYREGLVDSSVYAELYSTVFKGQTWKGRLQGRRKDSSIVEEDVTVSPVLDEEGNITHFVAIRRDVSEMTRLQRQLLQAQKLEAIGQLAAGIAHEINTPMQYVQNNVTFFEQAFSDMRGVFDELHRLSKEPTGSLPAELLDQIAAMDLEFVLEEVPESIKEIHDGIGRVVKIVAAMKEFSHPGSDSKVSTDLNRALESTITVCRNEWKYVAEMVTEFDHELPMVPCFPDQLNQAVLNLIINAAHAIESAGACFPDKPGRITVSTKKVDEWVEIRIQDTGGGIPPEIQHNIYDPFFTTKEVGKGTGQGLTIVHDIVVQKHGGSIDFITKQGEGTTFVLRLPVLSED